MESILSLIVNAENGRMLLMLVFGFSGFVWLKTSLEKKMDRLDRKIDGVEVSLRASINELRGEMNSRIDELKYNDFAHLSSDFAHLMNAFKALTYVLEKNDTLSKEDKEYVDGRFPAPT